MSKIVILTGAGISAESGVATFRDPKGVWAKFNLEDVATPAGFARDPARVQDFYNLRRRHLGSVRPNAAHEALARLEQELAGAGWASRFDEQMEGPATLVVPAFVERILSGTG
ncbi:Sir2 family NAD-dependent protein deacetylase [Mesorhizobium sp. ORM6]